MCVCVCVCVSGRVIYGLHNMMEASLLGGGAYRVTHTINYLILAIKIIMCGANLPTKAINYYTV